MRLTAKKRKNFLPTFGVALAFWGFWGFCFFRLSPDRIWSQIAFYLSLALAFFLTLALALGNSRRGFLATMGLVGFLVLRQLGIANALNLVFLMSFLVSLEIYFSRRS
jgi:hypothetical protein